MELLQKYDPRQAIVNSAPQQPQPIIKGDLCYEFFSGFCVHLLLGWFHVLSSMSGAPGTELRQRQPVATVKMPVASSQSPQPTVRQANVPLQQPNPSSPAVQPNQESSQTLLSPSASSQGVMIPPG